ncbi:hypothetical protein [Conexibacter woesei]|uniref:hypothetical protein n=1 Tax=Conexibacter woesei TaxID=191495 RepID=UPI0004078D47|nr:hypothetical protein [Conexibacter woesei]
MLLSIGLIVGGVAFIALAPVFGQIEIPDNTSAVTRLLGFGDDVASRYRRWAVAVVMGLACLAGGVYGLCA